MAYWGIAIALGPNYNLPTDPASETMAREMVAKAHALAAVDDGSATVEAVEARRVTG